MATINIMEIYSVKRSYNPLSSPASSLKRLKLSLNKDFALISPAKEEKFINELSNRNPDIKVFVPKKNELIRVWDWDI